MSRTITPRNCPGPGDEETWTPFDGNPMDPRCPDEEEPYVDPFDRGDYEYDQYKDQRGA